MIDTTAWVLAARQGKAVGKCPAHGCGGHLFCPTDDDGLTTPFHDRTDRDRDVTIRWYEADCNQCRAVFAYPDGRTAEDNARTVDRERGQRQSAQRTSEFMAGIGGQR